jgi:hypothetical protein
VEKLRLLHGLRKLFVFSPLPDTVVITMPRSPLPELLAAALYAMLAGANSFVDITEDCALQEIVVNTSLTLLT